MIGRVQAHVLVLGSLITRLDFVGRKSDEEIHCVKCNISMSHEECTPAVMLPEYTDVQIQICENVVPKIENQN